MIKDIELDSDEQLIQRIKKANIGLVPLWIMAASVFVGVLVGVFLIAKYQATVRAQTSIGLALILVIGSGLLLELLIYLAIKIYRGNHLILTNERLVLIYQAGIFHQAVSQLNLVDVQEATVKQPHLLANLFNYGTITIETAGEKDNLKFKLAESPHLFARQLDNAAEMYKKRQSNPYLTPQPAPPPAQNSL